MKKNLIVTTIVVALVLCLSFGAFAADITSPAGDDNQYKITQSLQDFAATSNLFIGTLEKWKAAGGIVGDTGTFFQNGEAINNNDIILTNGKVGVVLAVGTRNPWGYPAGSILDAGTVSVTGNDITKATAKRDTTWSIEFLVNGWDGWAPGNAGVVTFDLVKYDFSTKAEAATGIDAVKVSRIYNVGGVKFDVVTYYGIKADSDTVYMFDTLKNTTGADIVKQSNRFSMTNKGDDGGAMYNIDNSKVLGSYGNIEGKPYSISYCLPGTNTSSTGDSHAWNKTGGSLGYKELRANYTFKNNESVTFEEYITISDSPSMKAFYDFKYAYDGTSTQTVSGVVKDSEGTTIKNPVVAVKKGNNTYGWFLGNASGEYSINLPAGEYKLFVERDGYAPGAETSVTVANEAVTQNLTAGEAKVKVTFNLKDQNGDPIWGKMILYKADGSSAYPMVRYTGDSVYQATTKGKIEAYVAPGDYKAAVFGEGYWFTSEPKEITGNTSTASVDVTIDEKLTLSAGWLSGDMHHHANKNDAFSDPTDVIPSLAASGLDVAFITDHDFTVNNQKAYDLTAQYGLSGFIPSEEVSCSWAHFNVIPQDKASYDYFLDKDSKNHVVNQFGKLQQFVDQTHEIGGTITANHPWYAYGLFYAYAHQAIPGGYTDDYDTIEINACNADTESWDTISSAAKLWTSYMDGTSIYDNIVTNTQVVTKKIHYLVGGSDTHDVLYPDFAKAANNYVNERNATTYASGKTRTIALTKTTTGAITDVGLSFANSVRDGHSYVTYGPLLDFNKVPGNTFNVNKNFSWDIDIQSLADVKDILILTDDSTDTWKDTSIKYNAALSKLNIESAKDICYKVYDDKAFASKETRWYAVMVVDANGNFAISNPVWAVQKDVLFEDAKGHWAAGSINALADLAIINGYPDGTFKPENKITRAEFAKMMAKIAPEVAADKKAKVSFSDAVKGEWYYDSVVYMAENGYINGYPDKTFKPNAEITREEIAQIVYKVKGLKDTTKSDIFKDVPSKLWSATAINTLADNALIKGYGDGTFRPSGFATRAEAATFVDNLIKSGK